jgi:imidazolonepropionase-like amidohydrolase
LIFSYEQLEQFFYKSNFQHLYIMLNEELVKPWKLPKHKIYVFQNGNVIDTVTGNIRRNATVTIRDGLIDSVEDIVEAKPPADGATIVNLSGRFICPGLIDCHVHLMAVPGFSDLGKAFSNHHDVSLLRQPYLCGQILGRGFTTVRDCGGALLALKEAIEDGVFPGPRLFISGHALSQTGGHGDTRGPHDRSQCCGGHTTGLGRLCDGVAECAKAVREEIRSGADFIKIMGGGGVSTPTDKIEHLQFTPEEIRTMSMCAANAGTWVTAHAYTPEAIRHCVDNGARGIEHGNFVDEPTAKYMAEKGVFLTPTLITYAEMASPRWPNYLPPESVAKNKVVLEAGLQSLKIAADAGVTICYGTDLLGPLTVAQTREFALRSAVMPPLALLQTATINAAKLLRQETSLGQIQPGFKADILVLEKNPLEDMTVFDDSSDTLVGIMKDGYLYKSKLNGVEEEFSIVSKILKSSL